MLWIHDGYRAIGRRGGLGMKNGANDMCAVVLEERRSSQLNAGRSFSYTLTRYLRVAGSNLTSENKICLPERRSPGRLLIMEQKRFDWISKVVPSDRGITT